MYGYRALDARHNLLYAGDRVVYPAGTCGVVQDSRTSEQTFFRGHEDDVLSLTLHPDGDTVATGSAGAEAAVCIWSASSGQLRAEIRGFHRRGVVALSFDSTGDRLATCGLDDQNSIAVYDWATQRLASSAPSPGRVFAAGFCPVGSRFVSGGVGHLCFWMVAGGAMTPGEADYGSSGSSVTVTALGWHPDGGAVTGSSTGTLYRWQADGEVCLWSCAAHSGPVYDIAFTGNVLVSAGKDGRVLVWAPPTMQRVDCIDLRAVAAQQLDAAGRPLGGSAGRTPAVRSLCASADGMRLLAGTSAGEAWELDVRAPGSWRIGALLVFATHGFCQSPGGRPPTPRACGLAAHPCELAFATVGDDASLRQWDCVLRACTLRRQLPAPGLAVAYAPDGATIAVGLSDGRLLMLDSTTAQQLHSVGNRRDALAVLAFSPSGRWLAAGYDDGSIDLCVSLLTK